MQHDGICQEELDHSHPTAWEVYCTEHLLNSIIYLFLGLGWQTQNVRETKNWVIHQPKTAWLYPEFKVCAGRGAGLPAVSRKICHYLCSPTPSQHFTSRFLCLHEGALHKSLKCLPINHDLAGTDRSILSLNARYQPRVCWLQYTLLKSCDGRSVDWLHNAQIHALRSAIHGLSKSTLCA